MSATTKRSKLTARDYDPLSPRDAWYFYNKPFQWAIALTRPVRFHLIMGFIGSILQSALALIPGLITGRLIDEVFVNGDFTNFWPYVIAIFVIPVIRSIINYVKRLFFEYVSQTILLRTRDSVYQHLQKLDAGYYSITPTGRIMTKLTGDLDMVRHIFAWTGFQLVQNTLMLGIGGVYLFFVEWRLALASFIFAPFLLILAQRFLVNIKPMWGRIRHQSEKLTSVVQENIGANRVTKAFVSHDYEIERFEKENVDFAQLNKDAARVRAKFIPVMDMLASLMYVPVILVGGTLAIRNIMTVGQIVTFNNLLWMIVDPMFMLGFYIDELQHFASCANKLIETLMTKTKISSPAETDITEFPEKADEDLVRASLDSPKFDKESLGGELEVIKNPEVERTVKIQSRSKLSGDDYAMKQYDVSTQRRGYIPDKPFPMKEYHLRSNLKTAKTKIDDLIVEHLEEFPAQRINLDGDVVFENVSYEYILYGQKVPALHNISFEVKAGQTIGIIGETGSGKTTLIEMISRLMDPSEGRILIDGRDLRTYPLEPLRRSIGVVTQNVFLFSDTVESNIAFSDLLMPFDRVTDAARVASADDFIERMEDGYNTITGEEGVGLSGGQRQRISLARAVAADPDILILDDTTSAVDMNTDAKIRKNLKEKLADKTVFMVAQRISSIRNSDQIFVMKDGRIVESGKHDELVELGGIYREIYDTQIGDSKEALQSVLGDIKEENNG